jgi:hypothetical protein
MEICIVLECMLTAQGRFTVGLAYALGKVAFRRFQHKMLRMVVRQ